MARIGILCATALAVIPVSAAAAPVTFVDVAPAAGVGKPTETYGASWGDMNGDGFLDLFVSNHREAPSLYLNMGDGTFYETAPQVTSWVNRPSADTHGGAFADFDNDGDQDLLISVGTGNPNQFFVNEQGALIDRTNDLGLEFDAVGGRLPVWLDYNADGLLDFVLTQFGGAALVFEQTPTGFVDTTSTVGVVCLRFQFGQLMDINGDGTLDFICPDDEIYPQKIYNTIPLPWQNITDQFPSVEKTADALIADFDNDQRMDMFVLSNVQLRPSSVHQADDYTIEANLIGGEKGFNFISNGPVTIDLDWNKFEDGFGLPRVLIGANEISPFEVPFTLDPADPNVAGLPASNPGAAPLMRIGYDPATQRWTIISQTENIYSEAYYVVTTTAPVTDLIATGLWGSDQTGSPTLIMNTPGGFTDTTFAAGLSAPVQCASVTAGDYDNDKDVDLYLGCRTGAENIENIYYDNQGNGNFVLVSGTNGAGGPIGANFSDNVGTADSVISGDYDNDGFLDIFVTNGLGLRPKNFGGPSNLFRNQGNSNHWIELDLVGTASTRDPVGARVTASSGGVTQLRVFNGGYHRWAQEPARMHFGLGSDTTADLTVQWPSGAVEVFNGVAADQIYRIVEGAGVPPEPASPSGTPLYACGTPAYDPGTEPGIYVWRDCLTDTWRFRFAAGGPWTVYEGNVVSLNAFPQVDGFSVESGDTFDATTDPLQVQYRFGMTGSGQDGMDIRLDENSDTCFSVDSPTSPAIYYGPFKSPMPSSFDIQTGGVCNTSLPEIDITDATASESDTQIEFTLTLMPASAGLVSVDVATADATATAGEDYTALAPTTVEFGPGETQKTVAIQILDDLVSEGAENLTLNLTNPVGALLASGSATGIINDNEASPCGEPAIDYATDAGVFIWKDCVSGEWMVRMTSGGSPTTLTYQGTIVSGAPFDSVTAFSNESSDVLDFTTDPLTISYTLKMINLGVDGIDIVPAVGANMCFDLDPVVGATVYVGSSKTVVTPPFDMESLGACSGLLPQITAPAATAAEADGQLDIDLSLSEASIDVVTVDVQTADASALAGLDYTGVPLTTITFNPGEITKTVSVPLLDDTEAEGSETLLLQLSNATNATLGTQSTILTINDDEVSPCDAPSITSSSESGIFLWRDCGTDNWHMTISAGGVYTNYTGTIRSTAAYAAATGEKLETSDTVDFYTVPTDISWSLIVSGGGIDKLNFTPASGATTCFETDPAFATAVFIGQAKTPVTAPFDLETLGACGSGLPTISLADQSVDESTGELQLSFTLSETTAEDVSLNFSTADNTALAGADFIGVAGASIVIPAGETSVTTSLAILDDALAEGDELLNIALSNPVNATFASTSAEITITDNEMSPCGQPAIDTATEAGVFVWQNCDTGQWSMLVSAGGVFSTYTGSINSTANFAQIAEVSIEAADSVDYATEPGTATWSMTVSGSGKDGLDFTPAAVSNTCFSATPAAGAQIYVGAAKHVSASPFDLRTLGACGAEPQLSIRDANAAEGDNVVFTVSLNKPAINDVSVNYISADIDASATVDYGAVFSTLTIPAGTMSGVISVATVDDGDIETNETFSINLSSPVGATLTTDSATGTIKDNDAAALSVNSVTASEAAGSIRFTVALSTANLVPVTVDVATADNTTTAGLDYTAIPLTTLTFNPGETTKTVDVTLIDDSDVEGTEIFVLELSNASGANIDTAIGAATITDNEPAPVISIAGASGNESGGPLTFTVTLPYSSSQSISVDYQTSDDTATGDVDYTAAGPTTLVFNPGETSKSIYVSLIDDTTIEPDETFTVELQNLVGAAAGTMSATGTIIDDEGNPTLTVDDITVNETDGVVAFTASLSAASTLPVAVDFTTANGTATAPEDYTTTFGTLTFNPGETSKNINVTVLDDLELEFTEFMLLNFSNPVDVNLGTSSATATIEDDEALVCGEPSVDPATEAVVAVWQDCDTGRWHTLMTAAGGWKSYPGQIISNQGFSNIVGISLEGSDLIEYTTDPSSIVFRLAMSPPGFDGFEFDVSPDATVCFNVNQPPGSSVIAGAAKTPVSSSFDLRTLGPCTNLPVLSADDINVIETDGTASFVLNLSAPSTEPVHVDFSVASGSAIAGNDFTGIAPGTLTFAPGETSKQIDVPLIDDTDIELDEIFTLQLDYIVNASFGTAKINKVVTATITDNEIASAFEINDATLNETDGTVSYTVELTTGTASAVNVTIESIDGTAVGGEDFAVLTPTVVTFPAGETTQTVSLNIIDDALAEGPESLQLLLSNPIGLPIARGTAIINLQDDEANPCGTPTYDPAIRAAYIWKNCTTNEWSVRVLSGPSWYAFNGELSSSAPFESLTPVSIEATDVLNLFEPARLQYSLSIGAGYDDGFDIRFAEGSRTCFGLGDPAGMDIFLGADKTPVTQPFYLDDLTYCEPWWPQVTIDNVNVAENDPAGMATLTLTLSSATAFGSSVDVMTLDNTAVSPADYTPVFTTVTFDPGQLVATVDIPIIDDLDPETPEDFMVQLSNALNARLSTVPGSDQGVVTITSDE